MMKFQFILDFHGHTRIAQTRPRQTVERGHFLRHLVEQTFDRRGTFWPVTLPTNSRKNSHSGRASPGGSTAFMNFCTRPLTFVNVPRFSACAQPGNR